jgi:4-hydroxy-tetrahydrodipicolinate reductase
VKVAIAGAGGRMGRALIEALLADRELSLAAAFDVAGSAAIGERLGNIKVLADAAQAIASAEVLIDFTRPEGTLAHLAHAKAMVIGTTGFSAAQKNSIAERARSIPIVMAANFAISTGWRRRRPASSPTAMTWRSSKPTTATRSMRPPAPPSSSAKWWRRP